MSDKINPDAICGHCNGRYADHFHEDQDYCFENTNGDTFTDEPSGIVLADWIETEKPELFASIVDEWKKENGHASTNQTTPMRTDESGIAEDEDEAAEQVSETA